MDAYEERAELAVPADRAFAWLADPGNLPRYLPPVELARMLQADEIQLEGTAPNGEAFRGTGYLRANHRARRLEWGSEVSRKYSGWLEVQPAGDARSEVRVHLEFGPRSEHGGEEALTDALRDTLATIQTQIGEPAMQARFGEPEAAPLPPSRART